MFFAADSFQLCWIDTQDSRNGRYFCHKSWSTVKVMASRYVTGETVPGWVKERTHRVSRIEKDKVLLG